VDFLAARYTAAGSASLYAARRVGHGMVVAGAIANPRTDYRAVVVGGGTDLVLGPGTGVTAVLAAAGATDGASARLYVMPRLAAGRLALTATAAYQPLGGESLRQAALNPLTMALRVTPALQLGAAATLEMADGRLPPAGLGPSVQLRVPGGAGGRGAGGGRPHQVGGPGGVQRRAPGGKGPPGQSVAGRSPPSDQQPRSSPGIIHRRESPLSRQGGGGVTRIEALG
jgi:hypothetical protein